MSKPVFRNDDRRWRHRGRRGAPWSAGEAWANSATGATEIEAVEQLAVLQEDRAGE